jgi:hypothetical protein
VQTFVVADAAINDLRQSKARIAEDRLNTTKPFGFELPLPELMSAAKPCSVGS